MKPSSNASLAASAGAATLVVATVSLSLWMYHHSKRSRKSDLSSGGDSGNDDDGARKQKKNDAMIHKEINVEGSSSTAVDDGLGRVLSQGTITIAYCSTTGTCQQFAKKLHKEILARLRSSSSDRQYKIVQLIQVSEVDWWDELLNNEGEEEADGSGGDNGDDSSGPPVLLFVLPTWTDGTLPPNSQNLTQSLSEISTDWRVAPEPLRSSNPATQLKVGCFGMGSSAYDTHTVGKPAKDVFSCLVGKLGARPLVSKNVGGKREGKAKSKSLMIGDSLYKSDIEGVTDSFKHTILGWKKTLGAMCTDLYQKAYVDTKKLKVYKNVYASKIKHQIKVIFPVHPYVSSDELDYLYKNGVIGWDIYSKHCLQNTSIPDFFREKKPPTPERLQEINMSQETPLNAKRKRSAR